MNGLFLRNLNLCNENLAREVLPFWKPSLLISLFGIQDRLIWSDTGNGHFTLVSAYQLLIRELQTLLCSLALSCIVPLFHPPLAVIGLLSCGTTSLNYLIHYCSLSDKCAATSSPWENVCLLGDVEGILFLPFVKTLSKKLCIILLNVSSSDQFLVRVPIRFILNNICRFFRSTKVSMVRIVKWAPWKRSWIHDLLSSNT